jgi:dienelactone hydrolase
MYLRLMESLPLLTLLTASCMAAQAPASTRIPLRSASAEDQFAAQERVEPYVPWVTRRHRPTRIDVRQVFRGGVVATMDPPAGAALVSYESEGRTLRGWFAEPSATSGKRPAVVYLHNDFALDAGSWDNALPFVHAGFSVFVPALRGENGNPGERELLFGEVDDARAAVRWLAAAPGVDPSRIYVIGHSVGGGIASLLALLPDSGVRATASVGGVYRAQTLHHWAQVEPGLVRFDVANDYEVSVRLFMTHIRDVRTPHYAFAGRSDNFDPRYAEQAAQAARKFGVPVTHVPVEGDHMGSISEATARFVDIIRADLEANQTQSRDLVRPGPEERRR